MPSSPSIERTSNGEAHLGASSIFKITKEREMPTSDTHPCRAATAHHSYRKGSGLSWHRSGRLSISSGFWAVVTSALLALYSTTPAFAAPTFHTCKSLDVSTYAERIHVRCNVAASGGIVYFAVATANSAHAARMLSVLTTAHLTQKSIRVEFDPNDTSGTAFGCQAHDCRRLLSVGLL